MSVCEYSVCVSACVCEYNPMCMRMQSLVVLKAMVSPFSPLSVIVMATLLASKIGPFPW